MTKLELIDRFNRGEGDGALTAAALDQLIRDETIPAHFVTKDGRAGKLIHLAPATAAIVVLLQILQGAMGEQSPTPKKVVRALVPQIERAWRNPQMDLGELMFDQEFGDGSGRVLNVIIRPTFIEKARALVA
jgi:hypothetical protein